MRVVAVPFTTTAGDPTLPTIGRFPGQRPKSPGTIRLLRIDMALAWPAV